MLQCNCLLGFRDLGPKIVKRPAVAAGLQGEVKRLQRTTKAAEDEASSAMGTVLRVSPACTLTLWIQGPAE